MDDAIRSWNPWWGTGEVPAQLRGVPRPEAARIVAWLDRPEVLVLAGVRRAGKTTLLYQLIDRLLARGVPRTDILFLNLEDPALAGVPTRQLIDAGGTPGDAAQRYVVLDEAQVRDDWEREVLVCYEQKRPVKFIVSGSSSVLVRGRHAELLTGRNVTFPIRPLSFQEYLRFRAPGADVAPGIDFLGYLDTGGFPAVVHAVPAQRRALLQGHLTDIVHRDVARPQGLDVEVVERLVRHLAETFARPHTARALSRATGITHHGTLTRHLEALLRSFLIFPVPQYVASPKPGTLASRPVRYYWIDTGLRNAQVRNPSHDLGRQAENVVALALTATRDEVRYWQDPGAKHEVDFVVRRPDGRLDAFQVCFSPGVLPDRERAGLRAFREQIPKKRLGDLTVLTRSGHGEEDGIRSVPIADWLQDPAVDPLHMGRP